MSSLAAMAQVLEEPQEIGATSISTTTAESFEAEAMPYLNDLFRMALRTLGNPDDAEEMVQETYLQAWKSFHRFEPGTNCRAWLYRILFHVIQHHRRKWWQVRVSSISEGEMPLEETIEYEPPVPQELTDEDVLAALERVPRHYRDVVLLADVEEFTYKEIAEILSVPVGTVMSRLNRGRRLLRAELATFAACYGISSSESVETCKL